MELPVKNTRGEVVDTVEVSDALFAVPLNRAVVHQSLVIYQINRRQGTHSTKTRAEVSGGGRKPWPQKHTGRSRQGSTRAPQWRHGGIVFGPRPRDHRRELPKRLRRLALKCVLSEKVRRDKLILVDSLSLDVPKTRDMAEILNNLGATSSTLIVTDGTQRNIVLAAHNLKKVWTLPVSLINAEQLLRRESLVMTLDAARKAEELWAVERPRRTGSGKAGSEPTSGEQADQEESG